MILDLLWRCPRLFLRNTYDKAIFGVVGVVCKVSKHWSEDFQNFCRDIRWLPNMLREVLKTQTLLKVLDHIKDAYGSIYKYIGWGFRGQLMNPCCLCLCLKFGIAFQHFSSFFRGPCMFVAGSKEATAELWVFHKDRKVL